MNLHEIRHQKMLDEIKKGKKVSRSKAVRLFCLSCCGFQQTEVDNCCGTDCVLFPFRRGNTQSGKKLLSELKKQNPYL